VIFAGGLVALVFMVGERGIIASMPFFVSLVALVGLSSVLFVFNDNLSPAERHEAAEPQAPYKGLVAVGVVASFGAGILLHAAQLQSQKQAVAARLKAIDQLTEQEASANSDDDEASSSDEETTTSYSSEPTYPGGGSDAPSVVSSSGNYIPPYSSSEIFSGNAASSNSAAY
jgi:hypothetical protein